MSFFRHWKDPQKHSKIINTTYKHSDFLDEFICFEQIWYWYICTYIEGRFGFLRSQGFQKYTYRYCSKHIVWRQPTVYSGLFSPILLKIKKITRFAQLFSGLKKCALFLVYFLKCCATLFCFFAHCCQNRGDFIKSPH